MQFGIHTLDDFELRGKTVLCRIDINQPIDRKSNTLKSTNRIEACVPTIREMAERGAKVVLMAHQGSDIEYKNYYSTKPHVRVLSSMLGREVTFVEDVCGPYAQKKIKELSSGEILLLDNVRFLAEEQTLFELQVNLTPEEQADTLLVRKLAPLGDLYVCDAFAAAHRAQPSLCGFEHRLPSAMGRLFEKEYCTISKIMGAPDRPCVFILGGAKIADAFLMMETLLKQKIADKVLTGGLVGNILLAGTGAEIGQKSMDFILKSNYQEFIEKAAQIYSEYKDKIELPTDAAWIENQERREGSIKEIPPYAGLEDIGKATVKAYSERIASAKTVFVNGPMGVFEKEETEYGTMHVWKALEQTSAFTVVGGGDSISAAEKYHCKQKMSYVCTGGGALIRFLSGEELPVVKALRMGAIKLVVKGRE